jgi:2-amino-4-hydroxy-6-hydroxymethyldihydropteridine diphosphokinase
VPPWRVLERKPVRAYIGLGGNLGDRRSYLERAVDLLGRDPDLRVAEVSSLHDTEPVGYVEQPRFLNAVAAVDTELGARELLERILAVERALGRERTGPRYGPRTIDLDLLLYGDEEIEEPDLVVPHPRLAERAFVLEPLAELAPDLVLPDGRRIADLARG